MLLKISKILGIVLVLNFYLTSNSYSDILKKIEVIGNDRISTETIKLLTSVSANQDLSQNNINEILKNLYDTNFFKNIIITFENQILLIKVEENPIIENIIYNGIKSSKILDILKENAYIRSRASYSEFILKNEKIRLSKILKELGYYNSIVDVLVENKNNNLVDVTFNIIQGKKSRIKKISFIGNKIFKDGKLRRVIASSEYKFWKIISGRKYLNENLVNLDKRLLINYYKNNGYYNVKINSSFAKLINENEFELIFNIDAKEKVYFGNLKLNLPNDFDKKNFERINILFKNIEGEPYSINLINKILDQIDLITTLDQYQFIKATVKENQIENKINLDFNIKEVEDKYFVKKINILGNNVTYENVIRNELELDEGDPYNEILLNKSINNLKSLNLFSQVNTDIIDDNVSKTKIININIEEKPTGEIMASAGYGTTGGSVGFGIKENNFLGKGIKLDSNFIIESDSFKGKFAVTNPNYKNSDKSVYISAEASENDFYKTYGYKTNKTGILIGTNFEYLNDFYLGLGNSNFYEKIETNNEASSRMQSQEGDYWDSFINLDFNYDKRNQKFQTSSGFRSFYSLDLPLISDTNTLKNYYTYSYYFDLFDKNISNISVYLESANSLNNKDIKLSERIKIPSKRLRGFESGRVGPKDGDDYIGGNYAYSLNFSSTIPQLFEESQNVDVLFFTDAADVRGVDYDSSLNSNKIRSSMGFALDWFSPIGPMNFSLAYPITKAEGDKTEKFRFNLGTTF